MELDEARVGEQRTASVGAERRRDVRVLGQRGAEVHVAVATGGQHHGVGRDGGDLAGDQVPHHDALGAAVRDDQVQHLRAGVQVHLPRGDLPQQCLGGGHLQLLPRLPAGVVRAGDLHATERAGGQLAAVLAGEGRADSVHVVDDPDALLGQAPGVRLAAPEVAALDGVLHEPGHGVVVHLAGTGRVDAALGRHGVGAARRVVEGEGLHVVAQLSQRCRRAAAGQAGAHHDHGELAAVQGGDQAVVQPPVRPDLGGGDLGRQAGQVGAHGAQLVEQGLGRRRSRHH